MFTGNNWSEIARHAPLNPTTGLPYHPQTLARVARGEVKNVMLHQFLTSVGAINHAKTKEIVRSPRNQTRTQASRGGVQHVSEQITELSEIAKAIRGETYSYPTDSGSSQRSERREI